MSNKNEFTRVLRRWAEVFMHRSMRDFNRFTRERGLSMPQLNALMGLHHHGECAMSDLSERMGVTPAASSQLIQRLVELGYLERSEDLADRRIKRISLTPKGTELMREFIDARQRWMERLTDALNPTQQHEIMSALQILIDAATNLDEPAAGQVIHQES